MEYVSPMTDLRRLVDAAWMEFLYDHPEIALNWHTHLGERMKELTSGRIDEKEYIEKWLSNEKGKVK